MRSSGAFLAPFGRWEEWEPMLYPLLIASLRLGNGADQVDEHSCSVLRRLDGGPPDSGRRTLEVGGAAL
ncbi:hypothetical protein CSPX01_07211 [Colletotrichum filicis]|nr:hypothetical protein CSPX01_07211 [Colletotrichum filicis]